MARYSELTNLLPIKRSKALRRSYFLRLTSVALGLLTLLVIIHGILLLPAYLYAHTQAAREQTELDRISASASSAQEREANAQVAAVRSDATYLGRLGTEPTASGAVRAVLAVPHTGITITGFTFAAPSGTAQAQMTVTGVASTRDALRAYADSLGKLSYVSKADLPISAYAKDSAIPFTITLTGSLNPYPLP